MDSMDTVYVGAPEGTSVFGWLDSGTLRLLAAADEEEAAALLMSRHGATAACALVGRVRGSDFRALAGVSKGARPVRSRVKALASSKA